MSAINILVQRNAANMMTDGLSYIDGVPCEVNLNKAHVLQGMAAAISATGPAGLGGFIAEYLEREFSLFDDLVARGSERIKKLFREYACAHRNGDAVSTLSVIGWSERDSRPAAFVIDLETDGPKAQWVEKNSPHPPGFGVVTALTEVRVSAVPCPTAEEFKEAGYDLAGDLDAKDAASDLVHILEIQRRKKYDDGNYYVGGHAQLTTVTASGVTQRVIHEWPDKPGEKIVPRPINWKRWRRELKRAG